MGFWHLLAVLVVLLLLFGNRLPDVMKSLGKSVNEFKRGINESAEEDHQGSDGQSKSRQGGDSDKRSQG